MPSSPPLADLHRHVVQAATLAPSVHNTQPWRFTSFGDGGADGGLDLWADPDRRLPVLDPQGRQLHLSCGAALLHARVSARALGLDATADLLPDPSRPEHLARLHLQPGVPASDDDLALAEAILHRHTHREAFEPRRVPDALLELLRLAAEEQGARLRPVTRPEDLVELEVLLSRADAAEQADPAYRAEIEEWVRAGAADGIPPSALPDDPERGSSLRLRAFAPTASAAPSADPPVAEHPDVVVLVTEDDSVLSWLHAGLALGAVLLRAAQHGVLAQPLGQVTDLAGFRQGLARALGLLGTPQLVLRLGFATAAAATPRRDLGEVYSPDAPAS